MKQCYVAMEKVGLIFLHLKWLCLAVIGRYHLKLLMLFNLGFQMKCKYTVVLTMYWYTCDVHWIYQNSKFLFFLKL